MTRWAQYDPNTHETTGFRTVKREATHFQHIQSGDYIFFAFAQIDAAIEDCYHKGEVGQYGPQDCIPEQIHVIYAFREWTIAGPNPDQPRARAASWVVKDIQRIKNCCTFLVRDPVSPWQSKTNYPLREVVSDNSATYVDGDHPDSTNWEAANRMREALHLSGALGDVQRNLSRHVLVPQEFLQIDEKIDLPYAQPIIHLYLSVDSLLRQFSQFQTAGILKAQLNSHFRSLFSRLEEAFMGANLSFRSESQNLELFVLLTKLVTRTDTVRVQPKPDGTIEQDGIPFVVLEFESERTEKDEHRLHGDCIPISRIWQYLNGHARPVLAIYATAKGIARCYFLECDDVDQVAIHRAEYSLQKAKDHFSFLRMLINFVGASIHLARSSSKATLVKVTSQRLGKTLDSLSKRRRENVNKKRLGSSDIGGLTPMLGSKIVEYCDIGPASVKFISYGNNKKAILKILDDEECAIVSKLLHVSHPSNPILPGSQVLSNTAGTTFYLLTPVATTLTNALAAGQKVLGLAAELLKQLAFLHEHGIAHLDVKPDNIVIQDGHLHLIDFSVSELIDETPQSGFVGTNGWVAPEVHSGDFQPVKADDWAAGNLLLFLSDSISASEEQWVLRTVGSQLTQKDPAARLTVAQALGELEQLLDRAGHT